MSHYVEVKCEYKDQLALVEALEDIVGKGRVEVHETPVPIVHTAHKAGCADECEDQTGEACHIIVRRGRGVPEEDFRGDDRNADGTPWCGDLGFRRNPDGSFTQFSDEYDHEHGARCVRELPQRYARAVAIRHAKTSGWTVAEKVENGQVRLTLSKWGA